MGVKQNMADMARESAPGDQAELGDLLTMRMIYFFNVLRRSGVLAQRRLFSMTEAEWRIMVQVGLHAPLSLNRLAELTLQDRGQLSRTVKSMVSRDLLTRERKPGGPTVEIGLAPAGRELYAGMVERAVMRDQRLTGSLAPQDQEKLRQIMETMIGMAEEMLEEERRLA